MTRDFTTDEALSPDYEEDVEHVDYSFGLKRRSFVQILSAGLLIAVSAPALAQRRGGRGGGGTRSIAARVLLGKDGTITVMTGKVEGGQGARAELSQAAAEELRVPLSQIQLVMADTSLVPTTASPPAAAAPHARSRRCAREPRRRATCSLTSPASAGTWTTTPSS